MSEEVLPVAVVGVGYLGKFHAEKYASSEKAQLIGVVDVDHADEVSLFRRRILFGVELAEIADADHCYG